MGHSMEIFPLNSILICASMGPSGSKVDCEFFCFVKFSSKFELFLMFIHKTFTWNLKFHGSMKMHSGSCILEIIEWKLPSENANLKLHNGNCIMEMHSGDCTMECTCNLIYN